MFVLVFTIIFRLILLCSLFIDVKLVNRLNYLLILSVNMPKLNIWQLYTIIITMLIEM